jgi:hypothetical protein
LQPDSTAHPNGPPIGYSACVEIWGNNVTIDSTGTHHGEVNADGIRFPLRAWIDIFARKDITIVGDTTGNYARARERRHDRADVRALTAD